MKSVLNELLNATTITFLGMKGVGKTIGSSILANNINKHTIVVDIAGAYTINRLIDEAKYYLVDEYDKRLIVKALKEGFDEKNRIVFDVSKMTKSRIVDFVDLLSEILKIGGDVAVVIDEVGEVIPQSSGKYSEQFESLVRVGRNYGVKPIIMISQRPQKVDKNALALSDYYIIMRLTHNLDLNAVKELFGLSSVEFQPLAQEIKKLNVGECIIYKYNGDWFKAKFDMHTQDLLKSKGNTRIDEVLKED